MDGTTVSVRLSERAKKRFDQTLTALNIDKSEFLRACILRLIVERDKFLSKVGYVKKEVWTRDVKDGKVEIRKKEVEK